MKGENMRQISLYVTKEQHIWVKNKAKEQDISMSKLLNWELFGKD